MYPQGPKGGMVQYLLYDVPPLFFSKPFASLFLGAPIVASSSPSTQIHSAESLFIIRFLHVFLCIPSPNFFLLLLSLILICDSHRRDADYYPRVFSLLIDQLEICAREDDAKLFYTLYKDEEILVDLIGAHEFIQRIWEKWDRDGKIRKFRVIPEKY